MSETSAPERIDWVLAAGGVVVRDSGSGHWEVVLVHRPKYDDWSFPKGKLELGEDFEEAALREVLEETALVCRSVSELRGLHYRDARGRLKLVRYWLMEAVSGDVQDRAADREVDRIEWLDERQAAGRLSYAHDRTLLREAIESIASSSRSR